MVKQVRAMAFYVTLLATARLVCRISQFPKLVVTKEKVNTHEAMPPARKRALIIISTTAVIDVSRENKRTKIKKTKNANFIIFQKLTHYHPPLSLPYAIMLIYPRFIYNTFFFSLILRMSVKLSCVYSCQLNTSRFHESYLRSMQR